MKLSIVTTLYQSECSIEEFHSRACCAAESLVGDDYEIIMVNDGSPDNSLDIAVKLTKRDRHLTVVDLSRNFGHHKAMMTGLRHAVGENIFLIDSDLEEDPEWLIPFSERMALSRCDVVYGVQGTRKGDLFEKVSGHLFYRIFRSFTGLNLPDSIVVARLMSRRYVDALVAHKESEVFMAGLWLITGFEQMPISVKKKALSKTTYTLGKKISQLVNSITSFSSAPLTGIFVLGCSIFLISVAFTTYLIANWIFLAHPPTGYTSLIVSVWILGGLIIAINGILGIYLSKIYIETKDRPYTIVRDIFRENLDERNHL